jgi:LPXTG-site transpeptidase (sortase) family protein
MSRLLLRVLRTVSVFSVAGTLAMDPMASSVQASDVRANASSSETQKESVPQTKKTKKNDTANNAGSKKSQRSNARLPAEGTRLGMMFIPRLKMRSPIVEGVTDPMFGIGMGHWPGTAMPGERGNAVYGGHRTAGPAPLYYVERLQVGDPIIILKGLKKVEYRVISKRIVKPTALWIAHQSSGSMLTLFSCHPRHSTKQRYVIQALLKK